VVACVQALPSERPVQWDTPEELADLFSVYVGRERGEDKQAAMQALLGLSEADAASLKDLVASGAFRLEAEAEEAESFF